MSLCCGHAASSALAIEPAVPFESDSADQVGDEVEVVAIPYYAWANREIGAMRVWLPRG